MPVERMTREEKMSVLCLVPDLLFDCCSRVLEYAKNTDCFAVYCNADTEEAIESVRIKGVEFRENIRAFFPQGQTG